ncbi:MAG TPA: M24 family metallopeptidase [Acidobacteriaceae bacterium]|nr:M24 family metallopeptidase [Acidobacteriaceae bacterium]
MTTAAVLPETVAEEIETKQDRLAALMDEHGWSAVLLSRHENLAWATAGRVEARVALGTETAVCSLLITREGKRYYIAPENERPRLAEEEFAGLDCEPLLYPWTKDASTDLAHEAGGPEIGSDTAQAGFYPAHLAPLRTPLLAGETERFRKLGAAVADAAARVLRGLAPGVTEDEMAARISAELLREHIAPTVLLMGADERIFRYKHAVPRNGVLKKYGMLNLCARRHGMVISITRFVHFGAMPAELAANFEKAAQINAELLHATRAGATSAELYAVAAKGYADAGVPDEIAKHHQGGACGYLERDWVATPDGTERVDAVQGFAWNPSLRGAKAEDTALLRGGEIEILTATPELPAIETNVGGKIYRSAGVFLP